MASQSEIDTRKPYAKHVDILCYDYGKSIDFSYQVVYPDGRVELWQPHD